MAQKRLLVADPDTTEWTEFGRSLGEAWTVVGAPSAEAALQEAQRQSFDVVVANYDLAGPGAEELLNQIRTAHPDTLRFIAAKPDLKDQVMRSAAGGHQFLALPIDRKTLRNSIEHSLETDYGMTDNVRELVSRIRSFPTIPSIYLEVVNALKDPAATTADIGGIIARDLSMTTKLVQIINSAYFGLPRAITDPTEAVGILGFDTVKSLIMTVKLLGQYDKLKPVYFSIDQTWRHSTNVARTARVMALLETNDIECSGTAFTAGLMHDLGKVILAASFDEQYHDCHKAARRRQVPLWEVEREIFGATHGEVGAYLLARWGLPTEVVKIAALHHEPRRAGEKNFSALMAVHVANALDYEVHPDANGLKATTIDCDYLQELGMSARIELWRFARRNPKASDTKLHRRIAPVSPEKPVVTTPDPAPTQPAEPLKKKPAPAPIWRVVTAWVGFGLGAVAMVAFFVTLEMRQVERPMQQPSVPLKIQPAASITAWAPKPVSSASPAANSPLQAPSPSASIPVPVKKGFDAIQLQAIFYSSTHPSALINGKLAVVGDQVANCRILAIKPTSVTMEYEGQRTTLRLP